MYILIKINFVCNILAQKCIPYDPRIILLKASTILVAMVISKRPEEGSALQRLGLTSL